MWITTYFAYASNIFHFYVPLSACRVGGELLENRVEEILNGAGLNEVANIDLAVLVGMVENADILKVIGALMEFNKSSS